MKCPYCHVEFHDQPAVMGVTKPNGGLISEVNGRTTFAIKSRSCPACNRVIISLVRLMTVGIGIAPIPEPTQEERVVWPRGAARAPLPKEVAKELAREYHEASEVLSVSPRASAALSRRCLQSLLRGHVGVKPGDLANEIEEVLTRKELPPHLGMAIDAIRAVGNFAAHPIKSTNTGEIVDVEAGEAELLLSVLEGLFDFYLVQPARMAEKLAGVNKKLAEASKPPLKKP